ncbi:hypothetical protein HDU97_000097 [Phlyctochytrium planicorne]|nr:hypothetical protein HDU97_000097 [Phlyctochytrium planicorne]
MSGDGGTITRLPQGMKSNRREEATRDEGKICPQFAITARSISTGTTTTTAPYRVRALSGPASILIPQQPVGRRRNTMQMGMRRSATDPAQDGGRVGLMVAVLRQQQDHDNVNIMSSSDEQKRDGNRFNSGTSNQTAVASPTHIFAANRSSPPKSLNSLSQSLSRTTTSQSIRSNPSVRSNPSRNHTTRIPQTPVIPESIPWEGLILSDQTRRRSYSLTSRNPSEPETLEVRRHSLASSGVGGVTRMANQRRLSVGDSGGGSDGKGGMVRLSETAILERVIVATASSNASKPTLSLDTVEKTATLKLRTAMSTTTASSTSERNRRVSFSEHLEVEIKPVQMSAGIEIEQNQSDRLETMDTGATEEDKAPPPTIPKKPSHNAWKWMKRGGKMDSEKDEEKKGRGKKKQLHTFTKFSQALSAKMGHRAPSHRYMPADAPRE